MMAPHCEKFLSSKRTSTVDINCRLCILFPNVFNSNELKSALSLLVRTSLTFCAGLLPVTTIYVCSIAGQKFASRHEDALFVSLFRAVGNIFFHELGTQQVHQVIQVTLGFSRVTDANQCVKGMFHNIFVKKTVHYLSSTLAPTFSWWTFFLRKVDQWMMLLTRKIVKLSFLHELLKS